MLKKSRKGFTLIELLGVLIILSAIVLIAFPSILNQVKKSKIKIDEATKLLIGSAADLYLQENQNNYGYISGDTYCLSLKSLVEDGKLKEPIKDTSGNEISLDTFLQATVKNGKNVQYEVVKNCTEKNTTPTIPDDSDIIPDKNGNAPKIEFLSSNIIAPTVTTFDAMEGVVITDDKTPRSEIKVKVMGSVTLGVIGRYPIVYEAIDSDNNLTTEVRIVEVTIVDYTIVLNENRATTETTNISATMNNDVTLPNDPFTAKYGFTFKEWNTQANGLGKSYKAGEAVRNLHEGKVDTVNLYAIWERPDILYLFNGGVPSGMSFNANPYGGAARATVGSSLYVLSGWYKFPTITSSTVDVTGYSTIHIYISSAGAGSTPNFSSDYYAKFGGIMIINRSASDYSNVSDSGEKVLNISSIKSGAFEMGAGTTGYTGYEKDGASSITITSIWLTK